MGTSASLLHLVVLVAQVGGLVGIVDDAVEGQAQRVSEAEPAADEDEGDQPPGRVVPPVEVGRVLELGHDVLGQGAGQQLPALGVVVVVEHGAGGQGVVPAEPPDRVQEAVELADALGVDVAAGQLGVQVGQVAFQQFPVDLGEPGDVHRRRGEERAETGDRQGSLGGRPGAGPAAQPPPDPPLGQLFQPWLGDLGEPHRGGSFADAQVAEPPGITGILDVPAAARVELLDRAAGIDQQRPAGVSVAGTRPPGEPLEPRLPPGVLIAVQQRGRRAGGQERDHRLDRARRDLDRAVIVPALQGVLHLQPQVRVQAAQVDALVARD